MELFFIGIGGGRAVTDTQVFPTGGFRVHAKNFRMHVDPGPGALTRSHQFKQSPQKLEAVFCSHSHLDHVNDLNVLIEAMNFKKRAPETETVKYGTLYCAKSVVQETEGFAPSLDDHFKKMLEHVAVLKPGDVRHAAEGVKLTATKTIHEDETGIGFVLDDGDAKVGYTGDTQLFEGFTKQFEGCDALVINVLRPMNFKYPFHLSLDEAARAIKEMKKPPGLVFIYHIGLRYIQTGTKSQAQRFTKLSGVPAIIAPEGQAYPITREETAGKPREKKLSEF